MDDSDLFEFPLARNLILFTYLLDNIPKPISAKSDGHVDKRLNILWNIFYHIYLPDNDVTVLTDHVSKLIGISETLAIWSTSQYGNVVNFTSQTSLADVRSFWQQYAKTKAYNHDELISFEASARSTLTTIEQRLSDPMAGNPLGYRSTGAHSYYSAEAMLAANRAYWKTGVVAGNSRDMMALKSASGSRLNPTMVISSAPSGAFSVDDEPDPLHNFHLAEVFDTDMTSGQRKERLAAVAKAQFRVWCHSFAKHIHRDNVNILVHSGDAVNFCYELQDHHPSGTCLPKFTHFYTRPWSAESLSLVAPEFQSISESFDVIHASNLVDSVGLLNILPATIPLLRLSPFSTLYTECQLLAAEDPVDTLNALLFTDATTFTLLLGLAPAAHLTGFGTDSVGIEAFHLKHAWNKRNGQRKLRMLIPWKWPVSGDTYASEANEGSFGSFLKPISMDPEELAKWLFKLYLSMFNYENLIFSLRNQFSCVIFDTTKYSFGVSGRHLAGDMRYYSRTNLVILIRLIKMRI